MGLRPIGVGTIYNCNDRALDLRSWARRHLCATWIVHVDPSRCTVRNNLNCDICRLRACLVNHVMDVPAAYVSEALACTVGGGSAVGLIDGQRSLYHFDQAGTGMFALRIEG